MYGYSKTVKCKSTRPSFEGMDECFTLCKNFSYFLIFRIKAIRATTKVEKAKSSVNVIYIFTTSFDKGADHPSVSQGNSFVGVL